MKISISKINPRLVAASLLGGLPGAALVGVTEAHHKDAVRKYRKEVGKNIVPTGETIKSISPDTYVATSESDINKSELKSEDKKAVLEAYKRIKDYGGAFFVHGNHPMIVAPPEFNKYILGHEVGHREYFKGAPSFVKKLFEDKEEEAWKLSPFAEEPESKKMMRVAMNTYHAGRLRNAGIGLTAAGAVIGPIILKAMKK